MFGTSADSKLAIRQDAILRYADGYHRQLVDALEGAWAADFSLAGGVLAPRVEPANRAMTLGWTYELSAT